MAYSYDRRAWDRSVLPHTPGTIAERDEPERLRLLSDYLNQAGDLLEALSEAFKRDLEGGERTEVARAAKAMQGLARVMHDRAYAAEQPTA